LVNINECPVCLKTEKGISYPKCNHYVCIGCFKRCYYGENFEQPPFPYPNIEDENDQDNHEWGTEYPLIKIYERDLNLILDKQEIKHRKEKNLRKCPLCRN